MLSRRSFFKLASAAAITPILPSLVVEPEIIANAEFGFTWGNVQSSSPTFSKLITSTLTKRAPEIRKQLVGNNSLLVRLNSNKAIKITRITPEEQMERMKKKFVERAFEKHKKRYPNAHKYLISGEYGRQMNERDYYINYKET